MIKKLAIILAIFVTISTSSYAEVNVWQNTEPVPSVTKIAYLFDGPDSYFWRIAYYLRSEFEKFLSTENRINWSHDHDAGWDLEKMRELYFQNQNDPEIDLMIMSGIHAAQVVMEDLPPRKPVILADFYDSDLMNLPFQNGVSGIHNFTYLTKNQSIIDELYLFRNLVNFDTVHILVDYRDEEDLQFILNQNPALPFEVKFIFSRSTPEKTLARITREKVEALYLLPTQMRREDHRYLIREINERKIPTFSFRGFGDVKQGVFAAKTSRSFQEFAGRVAMMAGSIFKGEDPAFFPVAAQLESAWAINRRTAQLLQTELPFEVLMNAELFDIAQKQTEGELTLRKAVDEALLNHWLYRIAEEEIKSASKDHLLQWASYLPTFELQMADSLHAETGPLRFSVRDLFEDTKRVQVSLNQMIFSDPVFLKMAKDPNTYASIARLERRAQELDILEKTLKAYFYYLKVKLLQKNMFLKLNTIEQNLAFVRGRGEKGYDVQNEALKWGSILENEKAQAMKLESEVLRAKAYLNEIMNQGEDLIYLEREASFELLEYYTKGLYLEPFVKDVQTLLEMTHFLTEQSIRKSPEIEVLNLAMQFREKDIRSVLSRFVFQKDLISGQFVEDTETHFNSMEDFSAEASSGQYQDQRDDLKRLRFKKRLKEKELARDLRNAIFNLHHSLPTVELSRRAMTAEDDRYEILKKKYEKNEIAFFEFLDVWTEKFERQSQAIEALHAFLGDLVVFSRSLSHFHLLDPPPEREAWVTSLQTHLNQSSPTF